MGEIPNVAPGRQETVRIWDGGALLETRTQWSWSNIPGNWDKILWK